MHAHGHTPRLPGPDSGERGPVERESRSHNALGERRSIITIGTFDGVHAGHTRLVERAAELSRRADARVVAMAFDPHPLSVLRPEAAPPRLTTFARKCELLLHAGAEEIIRLEPTSELLQLTASEFVARLLLPLRPLFVVEGQDFRFGKGRSGSMSMLAALGEALEPARRFEVDIVPPVDVHFRDLTMAPASSTLTRWMLQHGRVRDAACILGRPHELTGTVRSGDRRGRTIGIPTANLDAEQLAPADGVYAAVATLPDRGRYAAAVNIGMRPTFAGVERRIEAHLLDAPVEPGTPRLRGLPEYGWTLSLALLAWVRDEVRFGSLDELKGQIWRDVAQVRCLCDAALHDNGSGHAGAVVQSSGALPGRRTNE